MSLRRTFDPDPAYPTEPQSRGAFTGVAAQFYPTAVVPADDPCTRDAAAFLARTRMDHTIDKAPALISETVAGPDGMPVESTQVVPDSFWLRRSDGTVVGPQTVGSGYTPWTLGQDGAPLIQPFLDRGATMAAAFPTHGQSRDTAIIEFPDFQTDGRSWYLHLRTGHGNGSVIGSFLGWKWICKNMENAIFGKGARAFSIPHTSGVKDRVAFAVRTMSKLESYMSDHAETLAAFEALRLPDLPATVCAILDVDKDSSSRAKNKAERIIDYARRSPGVSGRTALDVYDAFTFWASWDGMDKAGKTALGRWESATDGARAKTVAKAAAHLQELARVA